MIALALVALGVGLACRIDEPSRPALANVSRSAAPFNADSIHLAYVCGKRFRICNENDFPAEVTWDVIGSADSGHLTLPPRPAGQPYSETYLFTSVIGLTRLHYQGTVIEASPSLGTPCIVPATAPLITPDALILSLGEIVMGNGRRARPDILMLVFKEGTSQSVRQAVIDSVQGLVVGGYPMTYGESAYYVFVPAQRRGDRLLDAVEALLAMPSVAQAEIIFTEDGDQAAYRRPNDGSGFLKTDWRVLRQDSDGRNWALEAIDAPLAWGCETGSASVRIGIVDRSYAIGTEVDQNIVFPGYLPANASLADKHGLRVASVVGAPGNNSTSLTGIMWSVAIDFRDYFADPRDYQLVGDTLRRLGPGILLSLHLVAAGEAGAQILNLSRSNRWNQIAPDTSSATFAALWVPPGNTCEYDFISLVPPDSGTVRRTVTGIAPPPLGGVYCKDDGTFSPRIAPAGGFSTSRTSTRAWANMLKRRP